LRKALLSLLCISLLYAVQIAPESDISQSFWSPSLGAMGNSGVARFGVPAAFSLNPAVLAKNSGLFFSWFEAPFQDEFSNIVAQSGIYAYGFSFGAGYYLQQLTDIPITDYIDNRIRQNGVMTASTSQLSLSVAKKIVNLFVFKDFDMGYTFGSQWSSFHSMMTFTNKIGLVFSVNGIPNVYGGMVYNLSNDDRPYQVGLSYELDAYLLSLDYEGANLIGGVEYTLNKYLKMRVGADSDYYTSGIGFAYDRIYSPFEQNFSMIFDYTWLSPKIADVYESISYFSITLVENGRLLSPVFYRYPRFTNQSIIALQGWAPKESEIWIYQDDKQVAKTLSNAQGRWELPIYLKKDLTRLKAKTVQSLGNRESQHSKEIVIVRDNQNPSFRFEGTIRSNLLGLALQPNEPLKSNPRVNGRGASFTIPLYKGGYSITTDIGALGDQFDVHLEDHAGNHLKSSIKGGLLSFSLPQQKAIVTTKPKYLFKGTTDRFTSVEIKRNNHVVKPYVSISPEGGFQEVVSLEVGRNRILFATILPQGEFHYPFTIYRLFKFEDVEDEDLNRLATIGVLDRNRMFNPKSRVHQSDLMVWLYKIKERKRLDFNNSEQRLRKEAIAYASDLGWMADSDPTRLLTRVEAMSIIAKAFSLDTYAVSLEHQYFKNIGPSNRNVKLLNYFVEHGFLIVSNPIYELNKFVTKGELFSWLTRSSKLIELYDHVFVD
jgi:hypothetical protein